MILRKDVMCDAIGAVPTRQAKVQLVEFPGRCQCHRKSGARPPVAKLRFRTHSRTGLADGP